MTNYKDWCRLCGNLESLPKIDDNISIILETIFEVSLEDQKVCNDCNEYLAQFDIMLTRSKELEKMFKGLDEENPDDLCFRRLNAYRSHFKIPTKIEEIQPKKFKKEELIEHVEEEEEVYIMMEEDEDDHVKIEKEPQQSEEILIETLDDDENLIEIDPKHDVESIEEEIIEESLEDFDDESPYRRKNFNISLRKEFEDLFNFECHLCDQPAYPNMKLLARHCSIEHNELPSVKCCSEECGKMLSTWRRLVIHKEQHFPSDEALTCKICKRVFNTIRGFERHQKFHLNKYVCSFCAKIFKEQKTLRWHEETHKAPIEERKTVECPECTQKFITKQACENHISMKHVKVISSYCPVDGCGKGFFTSKAMREHQRIHQDRKFNCDNCEFKARTKSALFVHMESHSVAENFPCEICNLKFGTMRKLKSHLVMHSDETPFNCTTCDAKFKRSKDLKIHLSSHSGVRNFNCIFCSKSFTNGSNLRKHKLKDHPDELKDYEAIHGRGRKLNCY